MGLRIKFLLGFLILAMMLFLAGVWSIYQMRDLGFSVQSVLDDNYKSIAAGKRMIEAFERKDSAILLLILGKLQEGRRILEDADAVVRENLTILEGNVTLEGEKDLVDAITAAYGAYRALWAPPIVDTEREFNLAWYTSSVNPALARVRGAVDSLIAMNDAAMYKTASKLEDRATRAVMPGIVAVVAAFAFSLMFSLFVEVHVVKPLKRIIQGIADFRESGRAFDVRAPAKDELGRLAEAVRGLCTPSAAAGKAP